MQIHIAIIDHKHGRNVYATTTDDGLDSQIADYCREWWKRDGPTEPMPEDRAALIERYFDWCDEIGSPECLERTAIHLPEPTPVAPQPAAPVDHHQIVALAVMIAKKDNQAAHLREAASYATKPLPKQDYEREASSLDDDICQLCIEMQRLCRGTDAPAA